jgi:peptidoglycan hydrolase-like protein with peptidoglycan-binding domain
MMAIVLLVATSGLALVVNAASAKLGHRPGHLQAEGPVAVTPTPGPASPSLPTSPNSPTSRPSAATTGRPTAAPSATPATSAPALKPGKRLLGPGDHGPQVRALQARLRQIAWMSGDVTDNYGPATTAAVRGFQAKRGIPVTGYVDQRTRQRLEAMTHSPTEAELTNAITPMGNTPGKLDPRCTTGRALCIDKTSRTLRWVVDGNVRRTVDVRFGASYSPTREGVFHVYWKDADHVSTLYGSAMPDSMFFSRGQAVHYSSDFAARGYTGASHGCVNVRDRAGIDWIFSQVHVGDKVVIYWS